jgi:hypothetical protein
MQMRRLVDAAENSNSNPFFGMFLGIEFFIFLEKMYFGDGRVRGQIFNSILAPTEKFAPSQQWARLYWRLGAT